VFRWVTNGSSPWRGGGWMNGAELSEHEEAKG
jgi:hypothetical protein